MAKTKISEFNANPALNTDIDSINLAEGCAPSGINDAIRELMAQLKDWQSGASNDPYVVGSSGSLTLNQGTANGVAYLNGSKVVTSGSALTYNGSSTLTLTDANPRITLSNNSTGSTLTDYGSGGGSFYVGADNSTGSAFSTSAYARVLWGVGNYPIVFGVNNSEQMRLTSTGLGIGTSSPTEKLQVNGNILAGAGGQIMTVSGAAQYGARTANSVLFLTNNSEVMRLDSSGNLGLGVTPSAWGTAKAFELVGGSLSSYDNTQVYVNQGAYFSGANWYYKTSGISVSQYWQRSGAHVWYQAPSGTAGNAITFTQAMTLDSSGNLLINQTSGADGKLNVTNGNGGTICTLNSGGTSPAYAIQFKNTNGTIGNITVSGTTTAYNTSSDYRLKNTIAPMTGALAKVSLLKPCTYKWNADGSDGEGFIAHELAEVVPQCVTGEKDAVDENGNPKYQGIDTSFLVATLTAAIQELKAEFDAYKASHP